MPEEKLRNVTIRTMQGDIQRLQKGEEILPGKFVPLVAKKTGKEGILEKARQERMRVRLERKPAEKQKLAEAKKLAEEARIKQEETEKVRSEGEARMKREEEAKIKREEEVRMKREEEERKKREEEEMKMKQEEEARMKREEEERIKQEAKKKLWQEKLARAEKKAKELVPLEETQYTERKKAERELWTKKITLAKERAQELVHKSQQKQEEILDKKSFSLGIEIEAVQDKLKTIPEEEKPIELLIQEQEKKVIQLQEEQKRITTRLEKISLLKEEVEKEETSTQIAEKRREAEKKRWALADKEKEIEKLGWQKDDEIKETTTKLETAKENLLSLSEKKALLKGEEEELIDAKQIVNLRQEKIALDKKALQVEKLKKLPQKTLQQLDQQKDHLQKLLREILSHERDVEIENRDIEEEIQKTKPVKQMRELTQRSWKIEKERRGIEQKRWKTEEEMGRIEEKITKTKPEYQELEEEGEQLLKRKRDIEILLKFGVEKGNKILEGELEERERKSPPVKKEKVPSLDDLRKGIDSPEPLTKISPGKRLLEKVKSIPKKKILPLEEEEFYQDSLTQKDTAPKEIPETKIEASTEATKQETSSSVAQKELMQRLHRGGTPEEKVKQRFLSRIRGQGREPNKISDSSNLPPKKFLGKRRKATYQSADTLSIKGKPDQPKETKEKTDIRKALEAKIKANMDEPKEEKGLQNELKKYQKEEVPTPKSARGKLIQQLIQNSASEEKERQRFLSRVKGWKEGAGQSDLFPGESPGKQPEIIYRSKARRTSRVQKITLRILVVLIIIALGVVIYLVSKGYLI